ncbi:hypothetical protein C0Q70_17647 [Pomacea canaliculata]|uniref:Uncharacterized protein n=1 Tax=Pomacea canaliculata TaxID=400727 RepID=A0A2T7NL07_POMCA|nr:hypothetical protein C0Q70_17647 [Pomacea canaliculata]
MISCKRLPVRTHFPPSRLEAVATHRSQQFIPGELDGWDDGGVGMVVKERRKKKETGELDKKL